MENHAKMFHLYSTLTEYFLIFIRLGETDLAQAILNLREEVRKVSFELRGTTDRYILAYEYAILGLITEQIYITGLIDEKHLKENRYIGEILDYSYYTDCRVDISGDVIYVLENNKATSFGSFSLN